MHLRIARHTDQLEQLTKFYCELLQLELLGSFKDHDNYDGVFIGMSGSNWHIEFTQSNKSPEHSFDEDDILVFYPLNNKDYQKILNKITQLDIPIETSANPYWNRHGVQISDPDGYKIIISKQKVD